MLSGVSGRDVGGGSGYRGREDTKGDWRLEVGLWGERGCERWKGVGLGCGCLGLDGEV